MGVWITAWRSENSSQQWESQNPFAHNPGRLQTSSPPIPGKLPACACPGGSCLLSCTAAALQHRKHTGLTVKGEKQTEHYHPNYEIKISNYLTLVFIMHKLYARWYQLKEKSNYFTANSIGSARTWSLIQLILWDQIPVNRISWCWSF